MNLQGQFFLFLAHDMAPVLNRNPGPIGPELFSSLDDYVNDAEDDESLSTTFRRPFPNPISDRIHV